MWRKKRRKNGEGKRGKESSMKAHFFVFNAKK
jgi:hypothetical protein